MDAKKADKLMRSKALGEPARPTILDEDIKVSPIDRRSFLSQLGTRSAAFAGVVALAGGAAACTKREDRCDSDDGTDADPTDTGGRGRNDSCDTD